MRQNKKKILLFIDWYLPGYKAGGPIQSCANLVGQLKNHFDFSIVTRDTDYLEKSPYPSVKSNAWNVQPDGSRVFYFSDDKLKWKNINKIIAEEEYDILYLNSMFSPYFALIPLVLSQRRKNKKVVIASRGMLAGGALSVKSSKKKIFLALSRMLGLFSNIHFHATSEQEKNDIRGAFGNKANVKIAPNLTSSMPGSQPVKKVKEKGFLKLVSLARIAPEKNILYALQILEKLCKRIPAKESKISVDLYGPVYNEKYWKDCNEIIHRIKNTIQVNYRGSLEPDKIHSTLAGYDFLFMPTQGENFGHAIVQSFQAGTPVIISDKTPWRKLEENKAGWDISLSNEEEFITVILKALDMEQEEYRQLSLSSYNLARSFTANPEHLRQNIALFS